jgi:hypothetical protein
MGKIGRKLPVCFRALSWESGSSLSQSRVGPPWRRGAAHPSKRAKYLWCSRTPVPGVQSSSFGNSASRTICLFAPGDGVLFFGASIAWLWPKSKMGGTHAQDYLRTSDHCSTRRTGRGTAGYLSANCFGHLRWPDRECRPCAPSGAPNRAPCGSSALSDAVLAILPSKEAPLTESSADWFIFLVSFWMVSQRRSPTFRY